MKIVKEFREFAVKGNVVDMAIGIIIGAAFGKIVSSLVSDIITPPLGVVLGGVDFSGLNVLLKEATATTPAVTLNYGKFIQAMVDFLIVAMAMFSVVKVMNKVKRAEQSAPPAPAAPTKDQQLLSEIRDLLKAGK